MKPRILIAKRVKRRLPYQPTQLFNETCKRASRTITREGEQETNDYFFFLPFHGLWKYCLLTKSSITFHFLMLNVQYRH